MNIITDNYMRGDQKTMKESGREERRINGWPAAQLDLRIFTALDCQQSHFTCIASCRACVVLKKAEPEVERGLCNRLGTLIPPTALHNLKM